MDDQLKRFLKLRQVTDRVGLGRAAIYKAIKNGRFPKPYALGQLSGEGEGTAVRWLSSDVDRWIDARTKGAQ